MIGRPKCEERHNTKAIVDKGTGAAENRPDISSYDIPNIIPIIQGQYQEIRALASHPLLDHFAVSGDSGLIQIWDYKTKDVVNSRGFQRVDSCAEKEKANVNHEPLKYHIYSLAYSSSGKTLAAGFGNGVLRILDSQTLNDLQETVYGDQMGHKVSDHPVNRIIFSADGTYCAVSDSEHVVIILHKETVKVKVQDEEEDPLFGTSKYKAKEEPKSPRTRSARQRIEWMIIGRAKSHFKDVVGNGDDNTRSFLPKNQN